MRILYNVVSHYFVSCANDYLFVKEVIALICPSVEGKPLRALSGESMPYAGPLGERQSK